MTKIFLHICLIALVGCSQKGNNSILPQKIDMNWYFHIGDIEKGENCEINEKEWHLLDLPHDWSIEGQYYDGEDTGWQAGYLFSGIGWYQKVINWNPKWKGKLVSIYFEGIYLNSDVWINGHHLGHRPNGYISFEYELTDYLQKGKNIIAVRVDQSKPFTGRWYTGSGIYRHVWLNVKEPVYIPTWGVHFTTPVITSSESDYTVEVSVNNKNNSKQELEVEIELYNQTGEVISNATDKILVGGNDSCKIELKRIVKEPMLWSPDSPNLYSLHTSLIENGKILDEQIQKVGFRKLEFSSQFGFKLNGKITKFKGVCEHHTAGMVGAAVPDDVLLYRLKMLKEMGCNAIRTSHNPFSPSFYNICDSLGLMVMNEFLDGWDAEKVPNDYGIYFEDWWRKDAVDFISRDRNHPCVMIWSIGNEILKPTREVQKNMIDLFHKNDPTRPVTQGGHDPTRGMEGDNLPTQLNIKGFNGDGEEKGVLEVFHQNQPDVPMICTEVPHTYQSRGVYRTKTQWRRRDFPAPWEKHKWNGTLNGLETRVFPIPDLTDEEVFTEEQCSVYYQNGKEIPIEIKKDYQYNLYYQSSYDNASVRTSARKAWQRTRDLSYVMGQFRWGGFDYLGETNEWPSRFANFGVIDICGFPKDHFYLYQSMWTQKPMVHILPHWTHPGKEGIEIPVVAYTNCEEVELFLNDKSLGNKEYHDEQLIWNVPYSSGSLKAIAKIDGQLVAEDFEITAEDSRQIILNPDNKTIIANRSDVVHVELNISDEKGIFCPYADNLIEIEILGPAKLLGVDNGDPLDLTDYRSTKRKTFRGKLMILIKATGMPGKIIVQANSKDLKGAQTTIIANPKTNEKI